MAEITPITPPTPAPAQTVTSKPPNDPGAFLGFLEGFTAHGKDWRGEPKAIPRADCAEGKAMRRRNLSAATVTVIGAGMEA